MGRAAVADRVGSAPRLRSWIDELDEIGSPPRPPQLPAAPEAAALLARLAVPDGLAGAIAARLPSPTSDPGLWWLLERAYHRLTAGLGSDTRFEPSPDGRGAWGLWPALPDSFGAPGRMFYAHLFLAAVPDIRRWHEACGIDPAVSWATLEAYGRQVRPHPDDLAVPHVDVPAWLVLHFRGGIFRLGRLEVRRERCEWTAADLAGARAPFGPGDPVLDLHIPPNAPLTPASVDDAFRRARAFFGRHFPDDDSPWGVCSSWLLDPQLADHLRPDSNIIHFQRRFRLAPGPGQPSNASTVDFVFRRPATDLDALPQDTTLQRAIVAHIRSGGTWSSRHGWCAVGDERPGPSSLTP